MGAVVTLITFSLEVRRQAREGVSVCSVAF